MTTPYRTESLGPGELKFGAVGDEIDFSCQLTAATLKPAVDQDDDTPVLCGDVVPGERRYTFTLEMNVLQDWRAEGITAFSYERKGQAVPFTFEPDTSTGPTVTGTIVIDPMDLGGEAAQRATSDWNLGIVGDPDIDWTGDGLAPDTGPDDEV